MPGIAGPEFERRHNAMNQEICHYRKNIFDSTGLLPGRRWKTAVVHTLLLGLVVFLTEISGAHADGLFDFLGLGEYIVPCHAAAAAAGGNDAAKHADGSGFAGAVRP